MKRFLSSLWFLSILFIFISCEIGLGSSVDTEAPQLEIQNPSPDAIIRGAFRIGGIWSDDGTIETVTVKLSRTDGKGSEIEYQANFAESNDDSPNTWNCIINPQDSANTVIDGNYIAQVDITDGGKHTTTKTVQFAIDNTAPVIVLQRPSTKDDAQQLDSYGQKFTLEGQAADDNNVSLIEVQIFADKECTTLLHTVPLSNVPNSINLDVAEFKENIETDYSKIYGSTQKMGQKNFYCKVVAYDGAVYYPYDRTQTPEDLKGNKTNIYYLYEDIATAVLGEVKITDVYHILSGVYGLDKSSPKSAETNSLITKVKSTLEKNIVKTGSFSLNPANNPTFSVSGKDGLEKDENGKIDLSNGKYDILNKSQVVIEVSPGLDNIPLDSESLKVYFLECDVNGNAISTTKIYPTTVNSKSGSTYKFITPIGKSAGLSIGKYYLFGVDGTDQKNNSVVANSSLGYGFCCSSSGEAPTLTISQPVETSVNLLKDGKIKIAGTTSVEFNAPVITIKEGSTVLKTITLQESEGKEDPETKKIFYNFETEIGITGESANTSGYHEIDIISSCAGVNSSPRTKTINYDCDNPVIVLSTVSPVVERNEKKNLNAKTTFTFQLSDAFSFIETESEEKRPVYEFTAGDKTEKIISERKDSNITESLTIDTTKFPDNTPLKIKVTVYDRAGNKSVKEFNDYFIDQSTDIPTVENSKIDFSLKEINSINNNEDTTLNRISAGGTVTFTVKEDDGVDHISLYIFDDEGNGVEDINFRYPKEGSTNEILLSYQFTLPEKAGYYKYKLEVYDINNGTPFSEEFMLKAMNPAPKITVESTEITDDNDTENDGWIHAGGIYANKISIESTEFPITVYRKQKSSQETIEPVQLGKVPENSNINVYTDTFQPTETASYVYYVIDCNGQKSNEVTFEAKVDKDAPEIDKDKFNLPGKEATKLGSATITGKVTDNKGSGIKSIELTFSREGKFATISPDVADSWFQDISFNPNDENNALKELFNEEGKIDVTLKVTDYVGNSSIESKSFVYDKENPVITINDKSKIPAFINVEGTKANVTIKDSYKLGSLKVTQTYTSTKGENEKVECTKEFSNGKESTETIPLPLSSINDGTWIKGTPQEGTYSYTFEVTDSVGNTASEEINKIIYDNTAPTVEITNPVGRTEKDSINSESYRFEGTFDEKNLLYVYYKIGARDFGYGERPDISKDNGWEKAVISGTKWSFDKELVSGVTQQDNKLCEGSYDLYVCAIDQAGNVGELKKQSFDVDFNYPAVTFDWESASDKNTAHQESSTIYFNGDFTFTVDFKDSYGLAETKVLLGDEELTEHNISGDGVHNITKSYTIEKNKLGEGNSKLLTITAKDKFDKETPLKYTLWYDSEGPVIEIDSPGAGTSVGKNTISLKASVRDETSKVETKKVTYSISRTYNGQPESETQPIKNDSLTVTGEIIKVENFELCSDDDDKEGTYTITITAEDILGNKKSNTSTFYYDKSAPKLELNELSETTTNKDISVSGNVWDTNEIDSVKVFVDNEEQPRYEKVFVESERPKVKPESENFDVTFFVGAGNNNNSKLNLADGKHTIKVVAKDIAGKTTEETLSVLVDTKVPTIGDITITNTAIDNWYNKETLSFEGTMGDDGSGIEKIEYSLDNNFEDGHAHNLMISSKTAWRGNVNISKQGSNTIYFRATDYAGNISESKSYNVYIDSKAPNELKLVSVDGDEQTTWDSSTEKLTNGINDIKLVLTASDYHDEGEGTTYTGLGDGAIEIVKIGSSKYNSGTIISKTTSEEGQEKFTITIPKEKIAGGTVKAVVTDNAGNKSEEFELFTIKYDYLYPTVKINTPSDASAKKTGTQVNKTITLSGTATDNNELDPNSVKLQYSEDGGSTWKDLTEKDPNATVTLTNSEWTAKFDTTKFSNTTETKKIKLRGVATDKAGNVGNSGGNNENATNAYSDGNAIEIEIDQDTDRPIITITNLQIKKDMATNPIGFQDKTIYGLITDDDGTIKELYYSIDNQSNWTKIELSNSSFNFALEDGSKTVFFKIKDANGNEFVTKSSSSLESPKLEGFDNDSEDSPLYLKIDTTNPAVDSVRFKNAATPQWSTAISSQRFGGDPSHAKFTLEQSAADVNGIKSVTFEIPFVDGDKGSEGDDLHKATVTVIDGSPEDAPRSDGLTYTSFSHEFDVTGFKTGTRQVIVTVSDGIRETISKISLNIDNSAPSITVDSHVSNEQIRSSFLLKGMINEGDVGTKVEILPTASQDKPTSEDWKNAKELKGSTAMTWRAYFDGDTSNQDEYTHLGIPKDLFIDLYGTSENIEKNNSGAIVYKNSTTKYTKIKPFYFHFRVTDSLGNSNDGDCFVLKVDPQGDIPVITLLSPTKTETTQSGTIRFSGSAEDDKKIVGLYIEIDPKYNGSSFEPWSNTHKSPDETDITDVQRWKEKYPDNPYEFINSQVPPENQKETTTKAIFIGTSLSWNIALNKYGELNRINANEKENKVAVRFYAVDVDGNISEPTEPFIFEVDSDAPKIGSSVPFYLYQYNNDNTVKASVEYTDGMWLKGKWYLVGSVEDESGISTLTINSNDIKSSSAQQTWTNGEKSTHGYLVKYEIGNDSPDAAGTIEYKLDSTDIEGKVSTRTFNIKYDNKAPVLAQPTDEFYKISKKVQNENGFYTIKSSVNEGDSGFERVVFYFKRTTEGYHYVYDSYLGKNETGNKLAYDDSMNGISKSVTQDNTGLYWVSSSISKISGGTVTIEAENVNAHTGGIAKIGETIYRIKKADGTTITLEGNPSTEFVGNNIFFAIGHVVDHSGAESAGSKGNKKNGYYTDSPDDDGDNMIETVSTTGNRTIWSGSVNSRNVPDGEIEIHYVAFDKAGNTAHGVVTSKSESQDGVTVTDYDSQKPVSIANNAPRLAGVRVWTDYNGNGKEDSGEWETKFYKEKTYMIGGIYVKKSKEVTDTLIVSSNGNDYDSNSVSKFMTIRDNTKFYPELVGGNGNLYYSYKIGTKEEFNAKSGYKIEGYENVSGNSTTLGIGKDQGEDFMESDQEDSEYVDSYGTSNGIPFTTDNFGTGTGKISKNGLYWFEYVIYDSTEGCKTWDATQTGTTGRLSATMRIALDVDYFDETVPNANILPFFWKGKSPSENSISWDNGKALGHIELESDLTDDIKNTTVNGTSLGGDPKVSGKIIVRGTASDNIRLKELYAKFDTHSGLNKYTKIAEYENSTMKGKSGEGWSCQITEDNASTAGHDIKWELTVDTSFIGNTADLDKAITVFAVDARGIATTTIDGTQISGNTSYSKIGTTQTRAEALTAYYKMDIVPYVTGVKTSLSGLDRKVPSKFDRTALGHYPVRIVTKTQSKVTGSAETVEFTGFNLGDQTTLVVSSLETADDSTTGGKSAKYVPTVNGIFAINNMNNNNAKGSYSGTISDDSSYNDKVQYAYNRQPNNANNNRLTDDIIFDVWEFNSVAAEPISGKIEQPVMKIRPTDGKIGFAFVNGPLYFSMGGSESSQNYSYQYWMASYDFFTSVGFTYDDAGNSWGVAAGGDINSAHADKFQLMSSKWGLSQRDKDGSYSNTNSMRLESIGMLGTKVYQESTTENFDKQRIRSPSLAATDHGSNTNLYLAYYDAMNDELRFKAGREGRASYVLKVIRTDTPDSNYAGAWVVPPNNNRNIFADGDLIYLCDKDGNLSEDKYYTLGGYYKSNFGSSGQVAFVARDSEGNDIAPFPGTEGKGYTEDGNFHNLTDDVYIKVVKNTKSFVNGSSFYDFDTTNAPYSYRNSAVNIVAGDGTPKGAGEYVSLGVVPGTTAADDVVVITWYDTNARTLYYSYNTTPLTNRSGIVNQFGANDGWFTPVPVFEGKDYDYAGEYCKIAVDKNGGIHIAAYDPVNLDLVYAYASNYSSGFETCVVDSNGVVGSNLTLDVALDDNNKAVPFIGYYATSCIKPKYARFVGSSLSGTIDGSKNDEVTGKWEISVVPTDRVVEMQSNQHNDINIGVWKDSSSGSIKESSKGGSSTSNTSSGYSSTSNGQIFGNGTKNPVLGYAIKYGSSSDTIETAQMK